MAPRIRRPRRPALLQWAAPDPNLRPLRELRAGLHRPHLHRRSLWFIGDSVVGRVAEEDVDQRSLGELLVAELERRSGTRAYQFALSGMLPQLYLRVLRYALKARSKPDLLLIGVNLRSFSRQWHGNPAWAYPELHAALSKKLGDTLDPIPDSSPEAFARWNAQDVDVPAIAPLTVGDFDAIRADKPDDPERRAARTRLLFEFHYGAALRRDHPELLALVQAVELATAHGIAVSAYVTPLNVGTMRATAGESLTDRVATNAGIVLDELRRAGVVAAVDLTELLAPADFFYVEDPTEHINIQGRRKLVDAILDAGLCKGA
jgi:hypothetical protein